MLLSDKQVLKGESAKLIGLLEIAYFDSNYKAVNRLYEEHVLNSGDFDERIFLGKSLLYSILIQYYNISLCFPTAL